MKKTEAKISLSRSSKLLHDPLLVPLIDPRDPHLQNKPIRYLIKQILDDLVGLPLLIGFLSVSDVPEFFKLTLLIY